MMEAFVQQMPEEAQRAMGGNMRIAGTLDELVTTRVDVHDYVERKRDAFRAHVSQNDPNSWFMTMASQVYELAFGTEYYQLARGKPGPSLPEEDLFAGIEWRPSRRLKPPVWKFSRSRRAVTATGWWMRSASPRGFARRPTARSTCSACWSTTPMPPTTCSARGSRSSTNPTGSPGWSRAKKAPS